MSLLTQCYVSCGGHLLQDGGIRQGGVCFCFITNLHGLEQIKYINNAAGEGICNGNLRWSENYEAVSIGPFIRALHCQGSTYFSLSRAPLYSFTSCQMEMHKWKCIYINVN